MERETESERAPAERTSFKSVLWMSFPCVPASLNDALTLLSTSVKKTADASRRKTRIIAILTCYCKTHEIVNAASEGTRVRFEI